MVPHPKLGPGIVPETSEGLGKRASKGEAEPPREVSLLEAIVTEGRDAFKTWNAPLPTSLPAPPLAHASSAGCPPALAAFSQNLVESLERRFEQQDKLMHECLQHVQASSCTFGAATLSVKQSYGNVVTQSYSDGITTALTPDGEWQSRLEASLNSIRAMLEREVLPALGQRDLPGHVGSVRLAAEHREVEIHTFGKEVSDEPCVHDRCDKELSSRPSLKMKSLLDAWSPECVLPSAAGGSAGSSSEKIAPRPEGKDSRRSSQKETWHIFFEDKIEDCKQKYAKETRLSLFQTYHKHMVSWVEWWMSLHEPERTGCLAQCIDSRCFECVGAVMIVVNAIFAAFATNHEIHNLGNGQALALSIFEGFFLGYYVLELLLKLLVHRLYFFASVDAKWNIFDLILVLSAVNYEFVSMALGNSEDSPNLSYMRVLRILKLARILRVIRVAKVLSELRLMLNSIVGCFCSLFWGFVMLFLVYYVFGMVFVQGATSYLLMFEKTMDDVSRDSLMKAFGSVAASMLSLFMATTGGIDWRSIYSPMVEDMGGMYICLFIFLIAFVQLALMNILTGIFVENALKLAQPDRESLALEHRKQELREAGELRDIFRRIDDDQSGTISPQELHQNVRNDRLRAHLRVMGLDIKDAELFCKVLLEETGEGSVDIDDFVMGCMHMRGHATSLDLYALKMQMKRQDQRIRRFVEAIDARLSSMSREPKGPRTVKKRQRARSPRAERKQNEVGEEEEALPSVIM